MTKKEANVDFADAAYRHEKDAKLLYDHQRWPNADQLVGLAAECALKAVMRALGMKIRPEGSPEERKHRVHVDDLWDEFFAFANGNGGNRYAGMLRRENPFSDWRIEQRYHRSSAIGRPVVDAHREATAQVFVVLRAAREDGRL